MHIGDVLDVTYFRATSEGRISFPVHVSLALVGRRIFCQAFGVDPGALDGLSASNGLEILFGIEPSDTYEARPHELYGR